MRTHLLGRHVRQEGGRAAAFQRWVREPEAREGRKCVMCVCVCAGVMRCMYVCGGGAFQLWVREPGGWHDGYKCVVCARRCGALYVGGGRGEVEEVKLRHPLDDDAMPHD